MRRARPPGPIVPKFHALQGQGQHTHRRPGPLGLAGCFALLQLREGAGATQPGVDLNLLVGEARPRLGLVSLAARLFEGGASCLDLREQGVALDLHLPGERGSVGF